jgi:hypothetical protein
MARKTRAKPNYVCPVCGSECYISASQFEQAKKFPPTCSRECSWVIRHAAASNQFTVKCCVCGKPIYRRRYEQNKTKSRTGKFYCSNQCSGIGRSTEKPLNTQCAYCGKWFHKPEWEQRKKTKKGGKNDFCSVSCNISYKNSRRVFASNPNKLEKDFNAIFPELNYVGNGLLWVQVGKRGMNPDFLVPGTNKVIELFGTYWHTPEEETFRVERFKQGGYDCLVIWEGDFRNHTDVVVKRVHDFLAK